MLDTFFVVGGSVLTLFLLMAVGFVFGRLGLLSDSTLSQMSRILLNVVIPCIMVTAFEVERTAEVDRQLLTAFAALAGTYALYILGSHLLFRGRSEEHRGILRFASIYGNVGFMGLPLIQSVLGGAATMTAAMCLVVFNAVAFTHGMVLIGGKGSMSLKNLVLNPGALGLLAALALYLTGWRLPGPVNSAVGYLGSLNTPLPMLVIGGQMAHADLRLVFGDKKLYAATAIKLVGLPILTALVLLPFRLDSVIFTALIILSGCPTAGITSLFSQNLGKDASLAARQVTLSTLLCLVTLPLAAVLAQFLAVH